MESLLKMKKDLDEKQGTAFVYSSLLQLHGKLSLLVLQSLYLLSEKWHESFFIYFIANNFSV